jgi:hypothetical protein
MHPCSYENEKLFSLIASVNSEILFHYIQELECYIEKQPGTASENNLVRALQTYLNEQLVLAKRIENK